MDNLTDAQIAKQHRVFHATYGVNPFALMDIVSRYADTLRADNEMLAPAMALYNDIVALQTKYGALIQRFAANIPQNQAMISEALNVISPPINVIK